MTHMTSNDAKVAMAIGAISHFFGSKYGQMNVDRLFKTIGLANLPQGNKSEKISAVLTGYYETDRSLFATCMETLIQHHQLAPENIEKLRALTLRLDFDIKDERLVPSLGKQIVLSGNKPYDAFQAIETILFSAKKRIHIIDPYVDHSLFSLYLDEEPESVEIKILTKNMKGKFEAVARKFKAQRPNFEVRLSNDIHDRSILVDNRAWMFGQSLKNAGEKPLSIIEFEDISPVEEAFVHLWNKGRIFL
jgi:hypothetical protein